MAEAPHPTTVPPGDVGGPEPPPGVEDPRPAKRFTPSDERAGGAVALSVAALGIVFGDIGTSPLYAIRECFFGPHRVAPTHENVVGVLSLVFWSLVLIISVKYLLLVLRADNEGEGGILALMALARPEDGGPRRLLTRGRVLIILTGIFGAALLYGDGMITPAISVLSAVEGLSVATDAFDPLVIPITVAILVGLFLFQRKGTRRVGAVFGPVTIAWFLVLAALGLRSIVAAPGVMAAMNPAHAVAFFLRNGAQGFFVLGSVFLVVTGGEALYADMGHFGKRPIRLTWSLVVLPALVLNYFGQGALLLVDPAAADNPFYRLAPEWALYPLVALATAATIIASQAMISGAFSLTMQAVQLGYAPRIMTQHTSPTEYGQVYVPFVNWTLMLACVGLVLGFRTSSNLAGAYGVAVTTTMMITVILLAVVMRRVWAWSPAVVLPLTLGFLLIDGSFFAANLIKIPTGGWFALLVAGFFFALMTTWRRGRRILENRLAAARVSFDEFRDNLHRDPPQRVRGTAIYMTADPDTAPMPLVRNHAHHHVVHERVALLSIRTAEVPRVPAAQRVEVRELSDGFWTVLARYGFMETPNVPEIMALASLKRFRVDWAETTVFLGRERMIASRRPGGMALWREHLFAFMARNAQRATLYFRIPPDRVVEVGTTVEL